MQQTIENSNRHFHLFAKCIIGNPKWIAKNAMLQYSHAISHNEAYCLAIIKKKTYTQDNWNHLRNASTCLSHAIKPTGLEQDSASPHKKVLNQFEVNSMLSIKQIQTLFAQFRRDKIGSQPSVSAVCPPNYNNPLESQ